MIFVKRSAVLVLVSCVVLVVAEAQSGEERHESLFYIDKKPITTEEFVYLYRKNHQHKPEEFTREKIQEYLDLFINYKLKVEEALARGMDTTDTFRKEYKTYRDELLKPYMPDSKVVDSLVLLTYNRLQQEVNASHILVRLNPNATPEDTVTAYQKIVALRNRALAGEDFGALAAAFSEEPGAQTTRGNLGFFTAMQMVFPFEQAAYMTPVGAVSKPVRTQFGYHIVKVIDRQPSRGEVEVSHIMIRAQDPATAEEAKNAIFDVHDKLQKGVKWEELCAEYSEDVNTKDSGGRLRPFGVGAMASAPGFQEAAFSLQEPGDISDPVQTQFGWHILRLESKIPLPSFEEIKPSLTQRVSRDERVQISRETLRERMRQEFGYKEHASVKAALLANAQSVLRQESLSLKGFSDSTLFRMGDRQYRVKDFMHFIGVSKGTTPQQSMEDLISQYIDHVQIGLLEERVKRESPDYKWLIKEYYEGILLFEIMEQEVWNRAMEDTAGQKNYFDSNASKYTAGKQMPSGLQTFEEAKASVITDYQTFLEDSWIRELKRKFAVRVKKKAKRRAFALLTDSKG